jgi:hypothetical protein
MSHIAAAILEDKLYLEPISQGYTVVPAVGGLGVSTLADTKK